jgi:hypothetical protein
MYQESRLTQGLGAQIRHFCDNPAQRKFQEEIKWRPVTQAASQQQQQQQQKSITTLPRVQDFIQRVYTLLFNSSRTGDFNVASNPGEEATNYKCTKKTG